MVFALIFLLFSNLLVESPIISKEHSFGPELLNVYHRLTYVNSEGGVVITVPVEFESTTQSEWKRIGKLINSTNNTTFVLNWSGYGGRLDILADFIAAIQLSQEKGNIIVFNLTGKSYSSHGMAPCYGDRIRNNDVHFLMFHAEGRGFWNKEWRMPRWYSMIEKHLQQCVKVKVLTSFSVEKLWTGYEVYATEDSIWYKKDPRREFYDFDPNKRLEEQ